MELRGIHHVTIVVQDLQAALPFYTETLGLRPLPRPDFGIPGAWLDATGGDQVHLLELRDHPPATPAQHFAFEVGDLEAIVGELEGKGVAVKVAKPVAGAGRQATIVDPSGNTIELNQPAA